MLALVDTLIRGGAAKSEEGASETMPLGEIITKDDASKANITLEGDEEGSLSILSQYKSSSAEFFAEKVEEYDEKIETLEGKVEGIECSFDGFKKNFDDNVLNSPAMKNIASRLEAIESTVPTPAGRPKRRGTNSSAKPPRSMKKPRVASTSAARTPAMSARQKASILNHQHNHSGKTKEEAAVKRDKVSYIGRGGAK